MGQRRNDRRVATVGSPSSNYEVTLDIGKGSRAIPLVGSVVSLENAMGEGSELALGTVTEVVTTNKWHEDPTFRGLLRDTGEIAGMSGDDGDIRRAVIRIQAAWKRAAENEPWTASGPNLRMSPATGTPVCQISGGLVEELISGVEKVSYMGHLAGTEGIPLPLSMPDFSSSLGAFSTGVYGLTGSGKACDVNTPIPTPSGWKNMGDLVDGDIIFDEKGNPCRVVKAHKIMHGRPCYEVEFSDGSVIVADEEHLWFTMDVSARQSDSTIRNKRRVRRNRLSPDVVAALRETARRLSPLDVITAYDVQEKFGIDHGSHILKEAISQVGVAGSMRKMVLHNYNDIETEKTFPIAFYPAKELVTSLAQRVEMRQGARWNLDTAKDLYRFAETFSRDDTVTIQEVADVVGVSNRNGGLGRRIALTGIKPTIKPALVKVSIKAKTVTRPSTQSAITYPASALLTSLANLGEEICKDQRNLCKVGRVVTTKEIKDTLTNYANKFNHAVPVAHPLITEQNKSLPIEPYTLGLWLSDGSKGMPYFYTADPELVEFVKGDGYLVTKGGGKYEFRITLDPEKDTGKCLVCGGPVSSRLASFCGSVKCKNEARTSGIKAKDKRTLTTLLRKLGVLGDKHIPQEYLRSSIEQRRILLSGLMDGDGTADKNSSRVEFCNTNQRLADGVFELAVSLGYRPTIRESRAKLYGKDCGPKWTVAWSTEDPVFRLPRKIETHKNNSNNSKVRGSYRYITRVEPVESRPVRCITVDSPNALYLAGKAMIPTHNTQCVAMMLASQMRHEQHGIIIVDPQGQWASEEGMVFSVQGFAAELGREVIVRRISSDLRLAKDAPLMTNLLKHTRLVVELGLKHENTEDIVWYEITKALRNRDDWTKDNSEDLLKSILEYLAEDGPANRVYTTPDNAKRFQQRVQDVLDDTGLFKEALHQFSPVHNLFQAKNPSGNERHDLKRTLMSVFDRAGGGPAPLLILDMSSMALPGMDEEVDEGAERAYEILEKDTVKAAVLRNLFHTLKIASEDKFRSGTNLNTLVVLDEAWRYAAPTIKVDEEELQQLSKDLAGYARDTRKFGIGWLYISQSTRSVNLDIWDQMTVRLFGYGLNGADLEKMAEVIDDRSVLRLYRSSGNPRSTGVYPFMMAGPVSPLAANATPVMLQVYTLFQAFRDDNDHWIRPIRERMGLPVASGSPSSPRGMRAGSLKPRPAAVGSGNLRKDIIDSSKAVRENRAAGGMKDPSGFGDSLSDIDDDVPF